jgi:hypothetical protein
MNENRALILSDATASHRAATDAAGLCRDLVLKTAMKIQGRRYVQVEGWQTIANAFGCVASAKNVQRIEGGFTAIGQIIRLADGVVIAEAEGYVGDDESTWSKRPVFARRAMAQTRAMSRACRSAFAFVVTLMDAGLETTPAEEMTHVIEERSVAIDRKNVQAKVVEVAYIGPRIEEQPASEVYDKAAGAIVRAKSVDRCESIRAMLDERKASGLLTTFEFDDLVTQLHARIGQLIDAGQEVIA